MVEILASSMNYTGTQLRHFRKKNAKCHRAERREKGSGEGRAVNLCHISWESLWIMLRSVRPYQGITYILLCCYPHTSLCSYHEFVVEASKAPRLVYPGLRPGRRAGFVAPIFVALYSADTFGYGYIQHNIVLFISRRMDIFAKCSRRNNWVSGIVPDSAPMGLRLFEPIHSIFASTKQQ